MMSSEAMSSRDSILIQTAAQFSCMGFRGTVYLSRLLPSFHAWACHGWDAGDLDMDGMAVADAIKARLKINKGPSVTVDRKAPDGISLTVGLNANARFGPASVGAAYTAVSLTGGPTGYNGISGGLRPGGSGVTVNGNATLRVGYGKKIAPACGKSQ